MPKLTIAGHGDFEIEADTRLVLAIEDSGVPILHRCGGFARCTTCRVSFEAGEPEKMTAAEKDKLSDQGDLGNFRLSCQIVCEQDMTVEALMTLDTTDYDDPGNRPKDHITPDPEWVERP